MSKLTKSQDKAVSLALQHANNGNVSGAARILSSLYRAALKDAQKEIILSYAVIYGLASHPDF